MRISVSGSTRFDEVSGFLLGVSFEEKEKGEIRMLDGSTTQVALALSLERDRVLLAHAAIRICKVDTVSEPPLLDVSREKERGYIRIEAGSTSRVSLASNLEGDRVSLTHFVVWICTWTKLAGLFEM